MCHGHGYQNPIKLTKILNYAKCYSCAKIKWLNSLTYKVI